MDPTTTTKKKHKRQRNIFSLEMDKEREEMYTNIPPETTHKHRVHLLFDSNFREKFRNKR